MRMRAIGLLAILLATLALSISTWAQGATLEVVASHSILADVTRQVAGDKADVRSLIPVGADPHAYIPSPTDLTAVAEADLLLINGLGYEEALLEAIESAGEAANLVVASDCVEVRPFGAAIQHEDDHADEHDADHADDDDAEHADDHDDDEHADDHDDDDHADDHDDDDHADDHDDDDHADDDDAEHADDHDDDHADDMDEASDCDAHDAEFAAIVGEEESGHAHFVTLGRAEDIDCGGGHGHEDENDHGHGACDPHLWMDPHNVIYWVLKIRDTLSAHDPANTADYAANAAAYAQELVALESDFILPALMDLPAEQRVLVTSHESVGYLATTFGFELITTVVPGISTMVEPSARDVAALIDMVRDEGVPAIFGDHFAPQAIMSTIAAETGVALVGLFSDTLSDAEGPAATYLDYMRYNVSTIVSALQGGE